jgi:glucan phosphoethanolaminetransferase (alkaline phosphatase superfamily)
MKPFAKYPQIRNLLFANILGIIFFQFFIEKLLKVNSPEGGGGFEDLCYFSLTNMILCLLSINYWLWRVGWALLCLEAGLADYFFSNYGVSIDRDALTVFFQATPKDVGAFDISAILLYLIPTAILILAGWFLIRPSRNKLRLRSLSTVFYVAIICSVMGVGINNWSLVNKYAPYNFLSASYGYYQYSQELEQALRS